MQIPGNHRKPPQISVPKEPRQVKRNNKDSVLGPVVWTLLLPLLLGVGALSYAILVFAHFDSQRTSFPAMRENDCLSIGQLSDCLYYLNNTAEYGGWKLLASLLIGGVVGGVTMAVASKIKDVSS